MPLNFGNDSFEIAQGQAEAAVRYVKGWEDRVWAFERECAFAGCQDKVTVACSRERGGELQGDAEEPLDVGPRRVRRRVEGLLPPCIFKVMQNRRHLELDLCH